MNVDITLHNRVRTVRELPEDFYHELVPKGASGLVIMIWINHDDRVLVQFENTTRVVAVADLELEREWK